MLRCTLLIPMLLMSTLFASENEYGCWTDEAYKASTLDLINSPVKFDITSKWGLSVNTTLLLFGEMKKETWVAMMVDTDEDMVALRTDPTPVKDYVETRLNLRMAKIAKYKLEWNHMVVTWYLARRKGLPPAELLFTSYAD